MKINRKNDYFFKRLFGHEDTRDILARFLTVVLDVPIEPDELTLVECWGLYLNNMEGVTVEDVFMKNEEERRLYELREKGRRDFNSAMIGAERRGRQEGIQKGRQEGVQDMVLSMLARKMDASLISEISGMSAEKIETLRMTLERGND